MKKIFAFLILLTIIIALTNCIDSFFQLEPYTRSWLCSLKTDGTDLEQITEEFGNIVVTPDGEKIIGFYEYELYSMNPDGSGRTTILDSLEIYYAPSPSIAQTPEGIKLVFGCVGELYTLDLEENNLTNITNTPNIGDSYSSFSYNGNKITYRSIYNSCTSVSIMDYDSGNNQLVYSQQTSNYSNFKFPTLTMNNKIIYYSGSLSLIQGLYSVNIDGSGNHCIYDDYANFTISHDGSFIVFTTRQDKLYRMDIDGSNLIELSAQASDEFAPVLSLDDEKILYSYGPLYIINSDGSNPLKLTEFEVYGPYSVFGQKPYFFLDSNTLIVKLEIEYNQ